MINFRDFLKEKAMNMRTYSRLKTVVDGTALVGCEYEMLIPVHSNFYTDTIEDDRDFVDIDTLSFSELENYFEISRTENIKIRDDHDEWVEFQKSKFADDNYEKYLDLENDKDDAREKALEEAEYELDLTIDAWIEDVYKNLTRFVHEFNLEPTFGWENRRNGYVYDSLPDETSADTIKYAVHDAVLAFVNRESGITGSFSKWKAEDDGSIEGNGQGVEIISPPQKLEIAIDNMKKMFDFMNEHAETNSSTGFHINVSIPGLEHNLNKVKLLMFLGENYLLNLFNRSKNHFTIPHNKQMIKTVGRQEEISSDLLKLEEILNNSISDAKYRTVNFNKLAYGYLEFRIAGGSNYHKDVNKIISAVHRYVAAIEIACDPEAEKKEYYKKLAKMLDAFYTDIEDRGEALIRPDSKLYHFRRILAADFSLMTSGLYSIVNEPLDYVFSETTFIQTFVNVLGIFQRFKLSMTQSEARSISKYFFQKRPEVFKKFFSDINVVNKMKDENNNLIRDPAIIKFVIQELKKIGVQ